MSSLPAIELWPGGAPGALGKLPEDRPVLTPFLLPPCGKPRGCVIVLPGGGYGMRAAHEGVPIAEWLNSVGLCAAVLDYRVSPYRHPGPLADALRGIRLVRSRAKEWDIDPAHVGILGFSAGGHLAASAATLFNHPAYEPVDAIDHENARPDAAVLCYAVLSSGEFGHRGSFNNLLGPDPNPKLLELLSLEHQVSSETPPCFLWHTAEDFGVPVENSLGFTAALNRHRVPFALHVFTKGQHGVGLANHIPGTRDWTDLCAKWLVSLDFHASV